VGSHNVGEEGREGEEAEGEKRTKLKRVMKNF
jgi:hypothetical protein